MFVHMPITDAEVDQSLLPDWHMKVTSLVDIRISKSGEKKTLTDEEVEEKIQAETRKLALRRVKIIDGDKWACNYCYKVMAT